MTISINTSDYIKTKDVEFNGEKFKFYPMTTSKYLAYLEIQKKMQSQKKDDTKGTLEAAEDALEIIYSLFDDPKRVKEILEPVPLTEIHKIITILMEQE